MKRIIFAILILTGVANGQSDLTPYRNKSAKQIANTAHLDRIDTTWVNSRIGDPPRDLTSAIEKRAITPYDITAGTLQAAKDTASARFLPLLIPWNFTASTLTFKNADSALTILCYGTINITAPDTIPEGAQIIMRRSGRFNLSAAATTLRIEGIFDGGMKRRFYGDGAGNVRFSGLAVDVIRPEWWGAKSDSTIECSTAFQNAINSAPFGATIKLAPASGNVRTTSKGYIINNTVTIRGNNTQIHLMGAGSVIHNSGTDTVLVLTGVTPGSDSYKRAQNIISGIRFQKIGTIGTGVAVAFVNSTEQSIHDCQMDEFNAGLVFLNESSGWCEHNFVQQMRFVNCDTAIVFNAKGSGTSSFRNNHLEHIAIPAMSLSAIRATEHSQAVGIAVIGTGAASTPNVYQNFWVNVSMALTDSTTGVYINGRAQNLYGQITFENFGGTGERSRAFHFGPSATNLMFWIYTDFSTRASLDQAIYNESGVAPQSIYTQVVGQSLSQAHGHGAIWDDTHQLFVNSVISNSAISGFKSIVGDTQVVFEHIVTSAGVSRFRYPHEDPLEFVRVFPNDVSRLGPIRAHNIGRFASINDSSVIDVRDRNFIQLQSADGDIDSLTNLTGGIAGQTAMILFAEDSMIVDNLKGNTGRFFLSDNRDRRTPNGLRSLFYNYSDGVIGGNTWREMFTLWPMGTATWNVDQLTAGSTDSVMVGYYGAEIGDPVVVGLSSIVEANANFDLKGHVVKVDSIRVFATNRSAGTYDLASGTLRYKIVR